MATSDLFLYQLWHIYYLNGGRDRGALELGKRVGRAACNSVVFAHFAPAWLPWFYLIGTHRG
jgi:hypothetical protein